MGQERAARRSPVLAPRRPVASAAAAATAAAADTAAAATAAATAAISRVDAQQHVPRVDKPDCRPSRNDLIDNQHPGLSRHRTSHLRLSLILQPEAPQLAKGAVDEDAANASPRYGGARASERRRMAQSLLQQAQRARRSLER